MGTITFDIETLPCATPSLVEEFYKAAQQEAESLIAAVQAPSNYKDQAKIDEYIATKKAAIQAGMDADVSAKLSKTSFDGMYGRVACIAWAHGDEQILSTSENHDEATAIKRFYAGIQTDQQITFVGHNVHGFDLPFLKHRSIILGIKPPPAILRAMNAKPWSEHIADTMLMWSDNRDKRVSMDKLCRALGIAGKDGFDGSMVAETWPTDPRKVIDYCRDDVGRTRAIYKRLTFSHGG